MKEKGDNRFTLSQIMALVILAILALATIFFVYPQFSYWHNISNELNQARKNNITFSYNFNEARGVPEGWVPDIQIDLETHQPRGNLIVDDTIDAYGVARVNQTNVPTNLGKVRSITLYLQNSHRVPFSQNDNITEGANVILKKSANNSSRFEGTEKMCWTLEGSYAIEIVLLMENQTLNGMEIYQMYIGESHVTITVYPKSDYAQIVTNNVNLNLAIVVYFWTVVGTGRLILSLWDRKSPSQSDDNNDENGNGNSTVANDKTDKVTIKTTDNKGTNN